MPTSRFEWGKFGGSLTTRVAHVAGHLTVGFLAGIVKVVALGLEGDGGANGVFQARIALG